MMLACDVFNDGATFFASQTKHFRRFILRRVALASSDCRQRLWIWAQLLIDEYRMRTRAGYLLIWYLIFGQVYAVFGSQINETNERTSQGLLRACSGALASRRSVDQVSPFHSASMRRLIRQKFEAQPDRQSN